MTLNTEKPTEPLVLHTKTVRPEYFPRRYAGGIYRHIVGVGDGSRTIWLPDVDQDRVRQDAFPVPPGMPKNVMDYLQRYYVEGRYSLDRTCHVGATAITGAGFLEGEDALELAADVIRRGGVIDLGGLPADAHGVIGAILDHDKIFAVHSLVGVAPGLAIQTDGINEPFSLVSVPHAFDHYQHRYEDRGGFASELSNTPLKLYGPRT